MESSGLSLRNTLAHITATEAETNIDFKACNTVQRLFDFALYKDPRLMSAHCYPCPVKNHGLLQHIKEHLTCGGNGDSKEKAMSVIKNKNYQVCVLLEFDTNARIDMVSWMKYWCNTLTHLRQSPCHIDVYPCFLQTPIAEVKDLSNEIQNKLTVPQINNLLEVQEKSLLTSTKRWWKDVIEVSKGHNQAEEYKNSSLIIQGDDHISHPPLTTSIIFSDNSTNPHTQDFSYQSIPYNKVHTPDVQRTADLFCKEYTEPTSTLTRTLVVVCNNSHLFTDPSPQILAAKDCPKCLAISMKCRIKQENNKVIQAIAQECKQAMETVLEKYSNIAMLECSVSPETNNSVKIKATITKKKF